MIRISSETTSRPRLALLAHEGKRGDLRQLVRRHLTLLRRFRLLTTQADGDVIARDCLLPAERVGETAFGEDLEIAARIAEGTVVAVIFLRDPGPNAARDPDPYTLLRVCDAERVPMATNTAAAEVILHFLRLHGDAPTAHLEAVR